MCRRIWHWKRLDLGTTAKSGSTRNLLSALVATLLVVGAPVAVVVLLDRSGIVEAVAPLLVIATALSLATSRLGAIVWASRRGSGDVVFGDLMVWGWLRRWRQERQLSSALRLLGLRSGSGEGPEELDRRERAQLLEKLGAA